MGKFQSTLRKAVVKSAGQRFWVGATITSSTLTTTAQDFTTVSTGRLYIRNVLVKTDSTGLAGATNFELLSNNAKGVANIFVETVANLGANVTKCITDGAIQAETTTSDAHPTVTALPTVLETGKKIQFDGTAAPGTGAGTIDVFIEFERIDDNADITVLKSTF